MKVFLGLLALSFLIGILRPGRDWMRSAALLVLCALACGAYYFMNQI